jgi:hypothetical protein
VSWWFTTAEKQINGPPSNKNDCQPNQTPRRNNNRPAESLLRLRNETFNECLTADDRSRPSSRHVLVQAQKAVTPRKVESAEAFVQGIPQKRPCRKLGATLWPNMLISSDRFENPTEYAGLRLRRKLESRAGPSEQEGCLEQKPRWTHLFQGGTALWAGPSTAHANESRKRSPLD